MRHSLMDRLCVVVLLASHVTSSNALSAALPVQDFIDEKPANGLPGELPEPIGETLAEGVVLSQVGDEAFLFDSPSSAALIPGSPGWLVVAMQRGEFWACHPDSGQKQLFLDFRRQMQGIILFEEGVHGIAFHPQFLSNGLFYLTYSQNEPRRAVLSEMAVTPGYTKGGPPFADPTTERVLIEVEHPLAEHWGGNLVFGPDGTLYTGLGDGGLRGDPYRLAQNPWALHGKILRIDVDRRTGSLPYGIPDDNPFAKNQLWRPEIWALGLRNPWGLSFDKTTGHLWCADVGQDFWEEINVLTAGGNYGWSDRDGYWPLPTHEGARPFTDEAPIYSDPVHAYSRLRGEGLCIIGGFVYHGKKLPTVNGHYLFGDWAMGRLWSLEVQPLDLGGYEAVRRHKLYERPAGDTDSVNPTVIAADFEGEPLIFSQNGRVFRLEMP